MKNLGKYRAYPFPFYLTRTYYGTCMPNGPQQTLLLPSAIEIC